MMEIGQHVIVRTVNAGVFAGVLSAYNLAEKYVEMKDARRLWYWSDWSGAATLSELATKGVRYPDKCKFPVAVSEIMLTEVIETILMTDMAVRSVASVPVWSA